MRGVFMNSSIRGSRPLWMAPVALLLAAVAWLPAVHLLFRPAVGDYRGEAGGHLPRGAAALAARHLRLWEDPGTRAREIARMRATNAEWDFMGRTYLALALANLALHEPPHEARFLGILDTLLEETLRLEAAHGMYFFLMPYARAAPYRAQPARSCFIDSEIALMLAARQSVRARADYAPLLAGRIDQLVTMMEQSPSLCGESYPDECWLFDNANAAAAIALSDRLDGRDHGLFLGRWLERIKSSLVDGETGLLISSFRYDGTPRDGPEGSSIFMIAHALQVIDPAFAREQYQLARRHLGTSLLGFGFAREWPKSWQSGADVDSGPTIPLVGASAGASGLAFLGAAAFEDHSYLRALLTSLHFAGFPMRDGGELRFAASNQVGDAVLLYALVQGPLWQRVREASR